MSGRKEREKLKAKAKFGPCKNRTEATQKRLEMYRTRPKRDRTGRILYEAYQSRTTTPEQGRIQPDRRWFGNTHVVGQDQLARFREEMASAERNPYAVLLRSRKLPWALVNDNRATDPNLNGTADETVAQRLLEVESFGAVFGPKATRKRPNLAASHMCAPSATADDDADAADDDASFAAAAAAAQAEAQAMASGNVVDGGEITDDDDGLDDESNKNASDAQSTTTTSTTKGKKKIGATVAPAIAPSGQGSSNEYAALLARAAESHEMYDEDTDRNLGKMRKLTAERQQKRARVYEKGQSKRIWGELWKVVDSSDVIVEVLDARDPPGTRCRSLEDFITRKKKSKHLVLLLNKCDLVPTWATARWVQVLSKEYPTLAFHASLSNAFGKGSMIQLLRQFANLHAKDTQQISVGFVGYPNVGKSSVINTLNSSKACKVAPVAGQTKVWQYVTLMRRVFLIDCPGIVAPADADNESDIVLRGVVRIENVEDPEDHIAPLLLRTKPEYIERLYGIASWADHRDFLVQFARRSGKLLRGAEPDTATAARMVINDWLHGKIPYFVPPPMPTAAEADELAQQQEAAHRETLRNPRRNPDRLKAEDDREDEEKSRKRAAAADDDDDDAAAAAEKKKKKQAAEDAIEEDVEVDLSDNKDKNTPVVAMQDFSELVLSTQFTADDAKNPFARKTKKNKRNRNKNAVPPSESVKKEDGDESTAAAPDSDSAPEPVTQEKEQEEEEEESKPAKKRSRKVVFVEGPVTPDTKHAPASSKTKGKNAKKKEEEDAEPSWDDLVNA